jgi:hypothetical protein
VEAEPRVEGEEGYTTWSMFLTEHGQCSCDGCGGHLVEGTCLSCGCHHAIGHNRYHGRIALWTPSHPPGLCRAADRYRARERAEQDRQARKRWAAEQLDDPRG